ncbi:MAG: hypothetical protein ACTH18_12465, partial [Mammaliicoccus vitulinus]
MEDMNQKPKKKKGLLWGLLGCLGGIIIVIIAIVVIVSVFFSSVDEELNGTKEEKDEIADTASKTHEVGDTVKAGGVEVT